LTGNLSFLEGNFAKKIPIKNKKDFKGDLFFKEMGKKEFLHFIKKGKLESLFV
jgi:hypothetical protein